MAAPTVANIDITVAPPCTESTQRRQIAQYVGPSAYANGAGDAIDPEAVRMGKIFAVLTGPALSGGVGIALPVWSNEDGVFYWFDLAGNEIANGIDLSGYIQRIEVVGQ